MRTCPEGGTDRTYSLRELGTIHTPRQLPRRPERPHGLGRNVTMFDLAHRKVYGLHDPVMPMDEGHRLIVQHYHAANSTFNDALGNPLPFSEVQATASSISRWARRNLTTTKHDYQAMPDPTGAAVVNARHRDERDMLRAEVF